MTFCAIGAILCWAQIAAWILHSAVITQVTGNEVLPPKACAGLECYEVFSCKGFAWVTDHIRTPLGPIFGAIFFPLGFNACLHSFRMELRVVSLFLMLATFVFVGCFIGDIFYYETCNAYPGAAIEQTLLWPIPFPLRAGQQDQIAKLEFFPKETVDKITDGFQTMSWYCLFELVVCVLLMYTAREARMLGLLFERGPLGLGVHYGLAQFDEVINHEQIKKRFDTKSQFIADAAPKPWNSELEAPLAYHVGHDYGAFHNGTQKVENDDDEWNVLFDEQMDAAEKLKSLADRHNFVGKDVDKALERVAEAEQAYNNAVEKAGNESSGKTQEEIKAMEHFREEEVHKETHQEHVAEHLAEHHARHAAREAEEEGKSPQEVRMAQMQAYQHTLSKYHAEMLQLAKSRTLHEHYRHAEREHGYKDLHNELTKDVEDTRIYLEEARSHLAQTQVFQNNLDEKEELLMDQCAQQAQQESLAFDLERLAVENEMEELCEEAFYEAAADLEAAEELGEVAIGNDPETGEMLASEQQAESNPYSQGAEYNAARTTSGFMAYPGSVQYATTTVLTPRAAQYANNASASMMYASQSAIGSNQYPASMTYPQSPVASVQYAAPMTYPSAQHAASPVASQGFFMGSVPPATVVQTSGNFGSLGALSPNRVNQGTGPVPSNLQMTQP